MNVVERFLTYVKQDTQSSETSGTHPSSPGQLTLGAALAEELAGLGLEARMDGHGYVYGRLAATPGLEGERPLGLIAHLDTSPDAPGRDVKPRLVKYQGGPLVLNEALGIVMDPAEFESLERQRGRTLIVTDGTTLLGADDKAGAAEIVTALEYLRDHPEIPHGPVSVAFTPDEELGEGTMFFDREAFGAPVAYTVDGGELGELEYENFNGANALFTVHGFNIHPGSAKNKMKNALLMAVELVNLLPPAETPAHTEGYEGFYHLYHLTGDETRAEAALLIRDHDREKFEARKACLTRLAAYLNDKYGPGTVELALEDRYYNMKEKLAGHMELIDRAKAAMEAAGVEPRVVPIRGGTDGAQLSWMGLPCPNLSTGGLQFHGVFEYIPADALERMVQVLVELLRK